MGPKTSNFNSNCYEKGSSRDTYWHWLKGVFQCVKLNVFELFYLFMWHYTVHVYTVHHILYMFVYRIIIYFIGDFCFSLFSLYQKVYDFVKYKVWFCCLLFLFYFKQLLILLWWKKDGKPTNSLEVNSGGWFCDVM